MLKPHVFLNIQITLFLIKCYYVKLYNRYGITNINLIIGVFVKSLKIQKSDKKKIISKKP